MNTLFILGAKYFIGLSILLTIVVLIRSPRDSWRKKIAELVWVAALSYLLAKVAGHFYYDPRPFVVGNFTPLIPHVADNGFPSDHVLLASALAAVTTLWDKRVGALSWLLALLIAISRVSVGVHHVVDCVGSALAAIISVIILILWNQHKTIIT